MTQTAWSLVGRHSSFVIHSSFRFRHSDFHMRVVSYNILDGGEGRTDPLAEVILAQRADIVALVEADNLAVLERIARRLSMDFIHAPGNKSASALLTRWTLRDSINHAPLTSKL